MRPLRDGPPGVVPEHSPARNQESLPDFLRAELLLFLARQFDNNVGLISYTFEVSGQTAYNWVYGVSLPRAETLYLMLVGYPAFARRLQLVVENPAPRPPLARDLRRDAA